MGLQKSPFQEERKAPMLPFSGLHPVNVTSLRACEEEDYGKFVFFRRKKKKINKEVLGQFIIKWTLLS